MNILKIALRLLHLFSQYDWKWIGLLQNFVPCGVPYFHWTTYCIV